MAAFLLLLLLLLLRFLCFFTFNIISSFSQTPTFPNYVTFPVEKDMSTLQYTTQIFMGSPLSPNKFVLDLSGNYIWSVCKHPSSSRLAVPCGSLHCSTATDDTSCRVYSENSVTKIKEAGELVEDIVAVDYVDRVNARSIRALHHPFLFSSAPALLLNGLASGANGVLGLGNTRISLPSQISNYLGLNRKFAVCLSETDGVIIFGDGLFPSDNYILKSLVYTPLTFNKKGYHINVKSVKISGKRLSLGKSLVAKISTTTPYTSMESRVYDTFVKAYVLAASNMTRVAPVAPFGLCFRSSGADNAGKRPTVPIIDLVLQSEMVKWRIYGRNSMVKVSDEVKCLGILDGGLSQVSEIVIGGYQLEENLLEFNLGTSMLGFSSSLSMKDTCSNFKLFSNPTE